jgi:hypothetical protein
MIKTNLFWGVPRLINDSKQDVIGGKDSKICRANCRKTEIILTPTDIIFKIQECLGSRRCTGRLKNSHKSCNPNDKSIKPQKISQRAFVVLRRSGLSFFSLMSTICYQNYFLSREPMRWLLQRFIAFLCYRWLQEKKARLTHEMPRRVCWVFIAAAWHEAFHASVCSGCFSWSHLLITQV